MTPRTRRINGHWIPEGTRCACEKCLLLHAVTEATERAEKAGPPVPFDAGLLVDVLARPDEGRWRVDGLLGVDGRMLLTAQRKTGKTTLALGIARSLLTGEPLLGRFDVDPVPGRVAFLNYEVAAAQLARWASEAGVPGDRLLLVNLRGRTNPLRDDEGRDRLTALLRGHDVAAAVVDPFGRAYTGASQNDSGEVGAWLVDLDRVLTDAGVGEVVLTAHAGWNGERTRGASALEDWADTIVTLTRDDDTGERFLRAVGRDVEVDEDRLDYDPDTRSLVLAGAGGRQAARAERRSAELVDAVVAAVESEPGATVARLTELLRADGHALQRGDAGKAARAAAEAAIPSHPRDG